MDALTNNHLPGVWRSHTLGLDNSRIVPLILGDYMVLSHVPITHSPLMRQGYVVRRWDVSFINRFTLTGADIDGTLVGAY